MARRNRPQEPELPLFDLPLNPADDEHELVLRTDSTPERESKALETPAEEPSPPPALASPPPETAPDPSVADRPSPDPAKTIAGLGERWMGGLADLGVQVVMLGSMATASHLMGATVDLRDWRAFAALCAVFSFFYWIVSLAFWGQTPGMARFGHVARSRDGGRLAFGQTVLRWIGAILTLGLAGLPLLLTLMGRSLSDRLSESTTSKEASSR